MGAHGRAMNAAEEAYARLVAERRFIPEETPQDQRKRMSREYDQIRIAKAVRRNAQA